MRYTIHTTDRHWWGGRVTLVLDGAGSSLKEGELLIFDDNGGFSSINYARVLWMEARQVAHEHEDRLDALPIPVR